MKKSRTNKTKSKTQCHRRCKELRRTPKWSKTHFKRTEFRTTVLDASVNVELGLDKEMSHLHGTRLNIVQRDLMKTDGIDVEYGY